MEGTMKLRSATILSVSLLAFGLGAYAAVSQSNTTRTSEASGGLAAAEPAVIRASGDKGETCTHEGPACEPGESVRTEGHTHACDGATGEWKRRGEPCESRAIWSRARPPARLRGHVPGSGETLWIRFTSALQAPVFVRQPEDDPALRVQPDRKLPPRLESPAASGYQRAEQPWSPPRNSPIRREDTGAITAVAGELSNRR
jgi:hypothetical protein